MYSDIPTYLIGWSTVAHFPPDLSMCENLRMSHVHLPPFFSWVCSWEWNDKLLTCVRRDIKGWEGEEEVAAVRWERRGGGAVNKTNSAWGAQAVNLPATGFLCYSGTLQGEPETHWPGLAKNCAKVCCGQLVSVTRDSRVQSCLLGILHYYWGHW